MSAFDTLTTHVHDHPIPTFSPPYSLFTSLQYSPHLLPTSPENTLICNNKPCPFYMLPYHRDRIVQAATHLRWQIAVSVLEDLGYFQRKCEEGVEEFLKYNEEEDFEEEEVQVEGGRRDLRRELENGEIALRVRVIVSVTGTITVEANIIPPVPLSQLFPTTLDPDSFLSTNNTSPTTTTKLYEIYKVYLDRLPTPPSIFTSFKTTTRNQYDAARIRAGIENYAERKEVLMYSTADEGGWMMEGSLTNVYFFRDGEWTTPETLQDRLKTDDEDSGRGEWIGGAGGTGGTVRRWLLEKEMVKVKNIKKEDVKDGEMVYLSNGVRGVLLGKIVKFGE